MKEGLWELRGAQKQGKSVVCEISQPKIAPCENDHLLKSFRSHKTPHCEIKGWLRKWPSVAKSFRSPIATPAKIFATAKRPFGTRVPFRSPTLPFRNCEMGCEMACEIPLWLQNGCENAPWPRNWPLAAKSPIGCEIIILLRNDLQALKWLRNHLQAAKWPSSCEIDLRNGGRFTKTPCEAKGSCENPNRATQPCI